MEQLDVYLCGRLAGTLLRDNSGMLTFRYLADYLASNAAIPLSGTLPLGAEPFDERDIAAFFSNLLPDEGVRRRIADILRLSPEDTFGLLREIGGDCAGAVAFYEPPQRPNDPASPEFRGVRSESMTSFAAFPEPAHRTNSSRALRTARSYFHSTGRRPHTSSSQTSTGSQRAFSTNGSA